MRLLINFWWILVNFVPILRDGFCDLHDLLRIFDTVGFEPVGWASRLPALIFRPRDQAGRVREEGPGGGIGREGPGKGSEASKPNVFHYCWAQSVAPPWRHSRLRPATTRQKFNFPLFFVHCFGFGHPSRAPLCRSPAGGVFVNWRWGYCVRPIE